MKKYKQLTAAVLLSCATMLTPFHAEAAHDAVYKFSEDGKTMSVYIDDMTKPFINFMVYSASTTGDSKEYRDFFTAGNGINMLNEQQAITNGIAYVKDLLGSPTETPTIRLLLKPEVFNNAAAGSDTMDNGNSALGNYFLLNAGELANYKFKPGVDEQGDEIFYADTCVWIWPRNTGWDASDVGNLSRNIDTQSMSSVIVHELTHALGMQFNQYITITKEGKIVYKIGVDEDSDYANKYTLNCYDVYGKKAEIGDEIVYINAADKGKYQKEDGKFYMYLSNGYDSKGNGIHTYDSGCYFIGENVKKVLTVDGKLANLSFPVDSEITVPGLPLNGDEGYPELSHIELQNSFLSHQYFRNWSVPMEAELAMLEDLGYELDRRNFFGYSVYNDGLTITNNNGYFARVQDSSGNWHYDANEAPNTQDWGVGLHVYGQGNKITQTGNLFANGDYAIGIRLDGTQDNVLNLQSAVTANGKGGNGIAVTWGRNHTVNIQNGSSVQATGDGGVALRFDFGHNDIGDDVPSTEIVGSYIYYNNYRQSAYNMVFPKSQLLTALDGPLVKECNINGTIEGSAAAIYISKNALVKNININAGASISGDIISEWNPKGMWFSECDPVFLNNFMPEGENGLTNLNINQSMSFSDNIIGSESLVINVAADKNFESGTSTATTFALRDISAATVPTVSVHEINLLTGAVYNNNASLMVGNGAGNINLASGSKFNQLAGGSLTTTIDGSGNSTKFVLDQNSTVNLGGTLNIIPEKDFYGSQQTINLLADNPNGSLTFSSSINYIAPEGTTVETSVDSNGTITINRTRHFEDYGQSTAEKVLGQALSEQIDYLGSLEKNGQEWRKLYTELDALDKAGKASALKQLNPSAFNSAAQATIATHSMLNNLMSTGMGSFSYHERPEARSGGGRGPVSDSTAAKSGDLSVRTIKEGAGCVAAADVGDGVAHTTPKHNQWRNIVIPFSSYTDQHNGANAYTNHNSGMLGAMERTLDNGLTMGYHAALNHQSTSGNGATIKGEGLYLGAQASYAPAAWQGWETFASARVGVEQLRSHRNVSLGGYTGKADADWNGYSGNVRVGGALTKAHGDVKSGPFAALDYSFAHRPSINEKGGAISTALESTTYDSLRTQLGYRMSTNPKLVSDYDSTQWQAHASVVWNHELLSDNGTNTFSLTDLPGITVRDKAADYGRDSLGIMAGVTFKTPKKLDVTLSVGSDMYREGGHSIYGKANLEWKF